MRHHQVALRGGQFARECAEQRLGRFLAHAFGRESVGKTADLDEGERIGDQADITRLVQSAGVDMARLNQDLAEHRADIDAVLDRNGREAAALALQGTPAFIINGNLIPGGMPQAQLEAVIGRIRSGQPLR